ncbi:TerD family protein, partial [Lacticaseibacillus paracasei]
MTLSRGQKVKLADLTSSALLNIDINLKFNTETIDFSCFGVDKNNKLSDDRYMIFYNQLSSPEEAIKILNAGNSNPQRFSVDLSKLP